MAEPSHTRELTSRRQIEKFCDIVVIVIVFNLIDTFSWGDTRWTVKKNIIFRHQ